VLTGHGSECSPQEGGFLDLVLLLGDSPGLPLLECQFLVEPDGRKVVRARCAVITLSCRFAI